MLKEVLAIWENRVGLGEDITFDPEHVALLLRMGRVESVLDLPASGNAIPPPQQDRVRSLLAAAYLSGVDLVVERLPADDPVVTPCDIGACGPDGLLRGRGRGPAGRIGDDPVPFTLSGLGPDPQGPAASTGRA